MRAQIAAELSGGEVALDRSARRNRQARRTARREAAAAADPGRLPGRAAGDGPGGGRTAPAARRRRRSRRSTTWWPRYRRPRRGQHRRCARPYGHARRRHPRAVAGRPAGRPGPHRVDARRATTRPSTRSCRSCRPGDVLVINGGGDTTRALIGELIAEKAKARGVVGMVIDGAVRDGVELERIGFPVWSRGLCPAGPYKNGPGKHRRPGRRRRGGRLPGRPDRRRRRRCHRHPGRRGRRPACWAGARSRPTRRSAAPRSWPGVRDDRSVGADRLRRGDHRLERGVQTQHRRGDDRRVPRRLRVRPVRRRLGWATSATRLLDSMQEEVTFAGLAFVFMSYLLVKTPVLDKLIDLLNSVLGRLRGGPVYTVHRRRRHLRRDRAHRRGRHRRRRLGHRALDEALRRQRPRSPPPSSPAAPGWASASRSPRPCSSWSAGWPRRAHAARRDHPAAHLRRPLVPGLPPGAVLLPGPPERHPAHRPGAPHPVRPQPAHRVDLAAAVRRRS